MVAAIVMKFLLQMGSGSGIVPLTSPIGSAHQWGAGRGLPG